MAYKLPGAQGSSPGTQEFLGSSSSHACSHPHEQVSGSVYKSSGRHTFSLSSLARDEPVTVGGSASLIDSHRPCPRPPEPWGRHDIKAKSDSGEVETSPPDREHDLECIRMSGGRPFCISGEHSLSKVFLHDRALHSGSGCSRPPLAESSQECFSSSEHPALGSVQNQTGEGASSASCAEMAHSALVPGPSRDVIKPSLAYSSEEGPPLPGKRLNLAPQPGTVGPACLSA